MYQPWLYLRKIINTFCPRWILALSPRKWYSRKHWQEQKEGDIHGFDKYCSFNPRLPVLLWEINTRALNKNISILDIGCNCGYYLSELANQGYTNLKGIDISAEAIKFGKRTMGNLKDVPMIVNSFEDALPNLIKTYDIVYSLGATLELVHPSFDIIKHICNITNDYVILIIGENHHAYPRFWEYEFNQHGFMMVKCVRPFDGSRITGDNPSEINSLLVFKRIKKKI
jgi:SAM-dependent methyltransferase